jgi:hypothetical protein
LGLHLDFVLSEEYPRLSARIVCVS